MPTRIVARRARPEPGSRSSSAWRAGRRGGRARRQTTRSRRSARTVRASARRAARSRSVASGRRRVGRLEGAMTWTAAPLSRIGVKRSAARLLLRDRPAAQRSRRPRRRASRCAAIIAAARVMADSGRSVRRRRGLNRSSRSRTCRPFVVEAGDELGGSASVPTATGRCPMRVMKRAAACRIAASVGRRCSAPLSISTTTG